METIILILSCIGLAQAFFLCFYLLTLKKGNRKANLFLALMLLGLTIRVGKSVLNVYTDLGPWQRNLGLSGILLAGPFLWFYGRRLLEKDRRFSRKNYAHLFPFAFFVLFCTAIPNDNRPIAYVIYLLVFAHLAVYIGLSLQLLYKHRTLRDKQVLQWYRNLVIGVGLIWAFYMGNLAGFIPYYIGGAIFFSFLIYAFSFLLLKKPLFATEKYRNSVLDQVTSQKYLQQLKKLFEKEEPYRDSALNMAQMAKKLGISPRELSQVINENEHKNFSDFVNGYRIQKAKALLVDPHYVHEKIATVAYDCGFGNVTSFNLAFKAQTRLTPTQFRQKFRLA